MTSKELSVEEKQQNRDAIGLIVIVVFLGLLFFAFLWSLGSSRVLG